MTRYGIFINPEEWDSLLSHAIQAEKIGFDSVWIDDPLLTFNHDNAGGRLEAWTALTALTAKTSKIRLGNLVLNNSFRNPALLGKMVSSLDQISNGRIELGIGAGWYESEYLAYGYEYNKASERIDRLREGLIIMRKMFEEEIFDYSGNYWNLKGCRNLPKPVQNPFPIWVGGTGKKTLKVAVELATGMNISSTSVKETDQIFALVEKYCLEIDRPYENFKKSYFTRIHITKNEEERQEVIDNYHNTWHPKPPREYFDQLYIGTVEQIIEKLSKFRDRFEFDSYMFAALGTNSIKDPITVIFEQIIRELN